MTFAILLRGWYTWTCYFNFIFWYQNVNWWPKFEFTVVQDFIFIYIKNSQFWYKHSISKLFISTFLEINKDFKNDLVTSYKFTLKNTWPLEDRLHHFGFPAAKTPQYVLPKKAVRKKKPPMTAEMENRFPFGAPRQKLFLLNLTHHLFSPRHFSSQELTLFASHFLHLTDDYRFTVSTSHTFFYGTAAAKVSRTLKSTEDPAWHGTSLSLDRPVLS